MSERYCVACGENLTHEGFVIDDGLAYYCSEECLHKDYTEEEWTEMYADGEGTSYWTEWEDEDEEDLTGQHGYINVYSITREYGGAEEGGWYYNDFDCISSVPCIHDDKEAMIELIKKATAPMVFGNIYSVLGGREIEIVWEKTKAESETKERPHYE